MPSTLPGEHFPRAQNLTSKKRKRDGEAQQPLPDRVTSSAWLAAPESAPPKVDGERGCYFAVYHDGDRYVHAQDAPGFAPHHRKKADPVPWPKRARTHNANNKDASSTAHHHHQHHNHASERVPASLPHAHHQHEQQQLADVRHLRPGAVRAMTAPSRILQSQPNAGNRPQSALRSTHPLAPCHVCHRKPTRKSDLDSYSQCEGCGKRTCFVCLRGCPGWQSSWEVQASKVDTDKRAEGEEDQGLDVSVISEQEILSRSFHMEDVSPEPTLDDETEAQVEDGWVATGHRETICSKCCIERGVDGEIVCLGCLSRMESV